MLNRNHKIFTIDLGDDFIIKSLHFANEFNSFAYFNPNQYHKESDAFNHLLMIGSLEQFDFNGFRDFEKLDRHIEARKDFYYCHLNYDLKNQCENLTSSHPDAIGLQLIGLHTPEIIIEFSQHDATIWCPGDPDEVLEKIDKTKMTTKSSHAIFEPQVTKAQYLRNVNQLKEHIVQGDIYEINYCQQFVAHHATINPITTYIDLNDLSPAPFSCLYKTNEHYLIGASPERFLKRTKDKLISQPIKGTIKRGDSESEDTLLKRQLRNSEKEMAENMMIVDLVRNDLAKSSLPGTVKVDEMFGIYSFPNWHQMISTVSGTLKPGISSVQVIKHAFPMGSMTGAPKVKVMELIEQYENTMRGLYSGAFGYFLPNGDFDFNVTIRSLIYNNATKIASFHVGGAITYDADPAAEYQECLLKASAIGTLFTIREN